MIKKIGSGYMVKSEQCNLHIKFYGENIVRFAYSSSSESPEPTVAVIAEPEDVRAALKDNLLATELLNIEVTPGSLTVRITDSGGNLLNEDLRVVFDQCKIEKKKLWEAGIFGGGEKYGWLNQLGDKTANYNTDILFQAPVHHPLLEEMHTAIPLYIGAAPQGAYGIYFDNSSRTEFDFARSDPGIISFQAAGGNLDYYFIYDREVSDVIKGYSKLTGTTPLPSRLFLGYHQSRYSYETSDEVLAVAKDLRRHEIPCNVLYLDIHYLEAYKVFTVDRERFSDFKGLIRELKEMGFTVVVIVNPGVKIEEGYDVYEQGKQNGYFVTRPRGGLYEGAVWPGPAVFPDYLRSEVRRWWGEFYRELIDCGVGGIWNDMNEPS
ncbi:MAG: TIM-barrel domain-containing protein, partial [Thermodesulfobacteriota bacterium]